VRDDVIQHAAHQIDRNGEADALDAQVLGGMAVLMPTSAPLVSTSAPPELPKLMAASVWMKSSKVAMPSCSRLVALTMPCVTVCDSPIGSPIASTTSPTP
jgi:hypothetical protein